MRISGTKTSGSEVGSSSCSYSLAPPNMATVVLSNPKSTANSSHTVKWNERLCGLVSPRRPEARHATATSTVDQSDTKPPPTTASCSYPSETSPAEVDRGDQHELQRVFNYFDENGDGKISPSELRSRLSEVGGHEISHDDAEAVVKLSDTDGDGLLGFEDFVKLVKEEEEDERIGTLREAFSMYAEADQGEGGGAITPRSLKRMLSRLGEKKSIEQCVVMVSSFDINGDGVINFEEFLVMMM